MQLLTPSLALPTEYGKLYIERRQIAIAKHGETMRDIAALAQAERWRWRRIQQTLDAAGVPQLLTNGLSQYALSHLLDHVNGKTAFTMPAAVAVALATTAPTSTTTGATVVEANYTGYGRQAVAAAGFNAATAATPSVATNNGVITFGACTAGSSTLVGFLIADSATTGAGNALWYGTLTSVTINTTQTPPTIANTAMSLSITDS